MQLELARRANESPRAEKQSLAPREEMMNNQLRAGCLSTSGFVFSFCVRLGGLCF